MCRFMTSLERHSVDKNHHHNQDWFLKHKFNPLLIQILGHNLNIPEQMNILNTNLDNLYIHLFLDIFQQGRYLNIDY